MSYRAVGIKVERFGYGCYAAWVLLEDDGLGEDGTPNAYAGLPVERGPYKGCTHRRAWRKAYRDSGGLYLPLRDDRLIESNDHALLAGV